MLITMHLLIHDVLSIAHLVSRRVNDDLDTPWAQGRRRGRAQAQTQVQGQEFLEVGIAEGWPEPLIVPGCDSIDNLR